MDAPPTHRIRLTVHYDGSAFFGWQLQARDPSVQGELERVLSRLFARPTRVLGSGRTDRGVHATGQVATVDAPLKWEPAALRRAMNALLSPEVWIEAADVVPADFHPRYDALERTYVYRVGTVEHCRSPFHRRWCWPLGLPLDRGALDAAAAALPGDHSFLAFAKAGQEERGDRCIVQAAAWGAWEELGVEFRISANRYLHHMVRYLVGTMVEIGLGRRPVTEMRALLEGAPGLETSPPAPPEGLFLRAVRYPALRPSEGAATRAAGRRPPDDR